MICFMFDNEICSEQIFGVRSLAKNKIRLLRGILITREIAVFPVERFDRLNVRDVEGERRCVPGGYFFAFSAREDSLRKITRKVIRGIVSSITNTNAAGL